MQPNGHSKVGASSMERWVNCPGSVREVAKVPNPSSIEAATGTVAHEVAARCLTKGVRDVRKYVMAGFKTKQDGFEITVDDDMLDAVQVYLDHVYSLLAPSDTHLVEQGFHLAQIHPDCYGTADDVIWKPYSRHLHVTDYKNGAGKRVEIVGNKQARYYALGALLSCGFNAREVTVHIVQPRCDHEDGPIRSETFDAFDLLEWAADLKAAVLRTEDPNAPLVPGPHCRGTFCPRQATCPALEQRTQEMAKLEFSAVTPYEPAKLASALAFAGQAEAWAESVRKFAYAEALKGVEIPGFKLVAKRANRSWKDEAQAAKELKTLAPTVVTDDTLYERSMRSPAQVEKLLPKPYKNLLTNLIIKQSSGNTLAPVDDSRPAVRVLDAAAEFASVPLIESTEA